MPDILALRHAVFLGASDCQLGRTAGWFVQQLQPQGGIGQYLCQQAHAMKFRQSLTEDFTIRPTA